VNYLAILILAAVFAGLAIYQFRKHLLARQRKAKRVRRRGYQYAWDLVMRRPRNLRLPDGRSRDDH
jgi:hypothetical protein